MDYKYLQDKIVEIVAHRLNYYDLTDDGIAQRTFDEVAASLDGALDRYRNDPVFRSKTISLSCGLMQGITEFHNEEIEPLRQQLTAALAAIDLKDAALLNCERLIQECFGGGSDLEQVQLALDIKPDASALKAHDEALIERWRQGEQSRDSEGAAQSRPASSQETRR